MPSRKPGSSKSSRGASDLPRITSSELSFLLSQPRTPKVVIHLLGSCGLSHANLAEAVGASVTAIGNWSSGRSEPRDEQYEKLDFLRTIASHVLANRLDGDDERIVKAFFLGVPQGVVDERGQPCTTLKALAAGRSEVVVDAVRAFGAATASIHGTHADSGRSDVEARAIW